MLWELWRLDYLPRWTYRRDVFGMVFKRRSWWLAQKTGKQISELTIAVGRDSRISGPSILTDVCEILRNQRVRVLVCAVATTPAMFMATVFEGIDADGAMMITASHLPFNRNGFKFFG